jgi:hypothetical protein
MAVQAAHCEHVVMMHAQPTDKLEDGTVCFLGKHLRLIKWGCCLGCHSGLLA